jgi:methylglutaconyl-CoA hydratase
MRDFLTIKIELESDLATIWLNRPESKNTFNEKMIEEITDIYKTINRLQEIRFVILRGYGDVFCEGIDLNWFQDILKFSYEQNYFETQMLAKCFYSIYTCKKTTFAIIQGSSLGGALGLHAACDFSVCDDNTTFCLDDTKFGLIPSAVAPYIIKRTGEFGAKEIMLTAKKFNGKEAELMRLVNKSLPKDEVEAYVSSIITQMKSNGPKAVTFCKNMIYDISNILTIDETIDYTSKLIADIRASDEGQEGMAAYLKKRRPTWLKR